MNMSVMQMQAMGLDMTHARRSSIRDYNLLIPIIHGPRAQVGALFPFLQWTRTVARHLDLWRHSRHLYLLIAWSIDHGVTRGYTYA
jgi:hypothetical protein